MPHVDASEGKAVWYQGYAADATDEQAREAFERKYGHPPEKVLRDNGCVRAGPIGESDEG